MTKRYTALPFFMAIIFASIGFCDFVQASEKSCVALLSDTEKLVVPSNSGLVDGKHFESHFSPDQKIPADTKFNANFPVSRICDPDGHILLFRGIGQRPIENYFAAYPISYSLLPAIRNSAYALGGTRQDQTKTPEPFILIAEQNTNRDDIWTANWVGAETWQPMKLIPTAIYRATLPDDEVLVKPDVQNIVAFMPTDVFDQIIARLKEDNNQISLSKLVEFLNGLPVGRYEIDPNKSER